MSKKLWLNTKVDPELNREKEVLLPITKHHLYKMIIFSIILYSYESWNQFPKNQSLSHSKDKDEAHDEPESHPVTLSMYKNPLILFLRDKGADINKILKCLQFYSWGKALLFSELQSSSQRIKLGHLDFISFFWTKC